MTELMRGRPQRIDPARSAGAQAQWIRPAPEAIKKPNPEGSAVRRSTGPVIVLVVEDEAISALDLQMALEEAGHQVLGPASTVADALTLAETTRPDIALVDITLQSPADGLTLAGMLKERWNVATLVISGHTGLAQKARSVALGYVSKPYSCAVILQALEVICALQSGREPATIPSGLQLFDQAS